MLRSVLRPSLTFSATASTAKQTLLLSTSSASHPLLSYSTASSSSIRSSPNPSSSAGHSFLCPCCSSSALITAPSSSSSSSSARYFSSSSPFSPLSTIPSNRFSSSSSPPIKLNDEEVKRHLLSIPTWAKVQNKQSIKRTFEFKDFSSAWAFMSKVALYAEKVNHHPAWFNVYNKVEVELETHDCNGLSMKDIDFAKYLDKLYLAQ